MSISAQKKISRCWVKIPATTTNFGPGFDTFGAALSLYNVIVLERTPQQAPPWSDSPAMVVETLKGFEKKTGASLPNFKWSLHSQIPQARGLGSSATVRLGFLAGLNALAGFPLSKEEILECAIELEGHPDNVTPAFLGGFILCGPKKVLRTRIDPKLFFVAFVPQVEISTELSRKILPPEIKLKEAVQNLQRASMIAVCFFEKRYKDLSGLFVDYFHEPYRLASIPYWEELKRAALEAGALGFYLSGSGSTLMAIAYEDPTTVVHALKSESSRRSLSGEVLVLKPDNIGLRLSYR
ncbi:homoserine kinase [Candidatus Methylacidiphilum infernorum]|uniref:Homoserine kinase n=1 Tax=Candidatus Methylacidiphilum infernorum TaxID=511746 RepID=A0ABX7PTB4_9BACT|nr:homoserine kinase [Candidatus Methylacidiphilum infernorum]QSR85928.1 homoserine kinase [Candidatus Methylacidiphilum infernorum]